MISKVSKKKKGWVCIVIHSKVKDTFKERERERKREREGGLSERTFNYKMVIRCRDTFVSK